MSTIESLGDNLNRVLESVEDPLEQLKQHRALIRFGDSANLIFRTLKRHVEYFVKHIEEPNTAENWLRILRKEESENSQEQPGSLYKDLRAAAIYFPGFKVKDLRFALLISGTRNGAFHSESGKAMIEGRWDDMVDHLAEDLNLVHSMDDSRVRSSLGKFIKFYQDSHVVRDEVAGTWHDISNIPEDVMTRDADAETKKLDAKSAVLVVFGGTAEPSHASEDRPDENQPPDASTTVSTDKESSSDLITKIKDACEYLTSVGDDKDKKEAAKALGICHKTLHKLVKRKRAKSHELSEPPALRVKR